MADHNKPTVTSLYANFVAELDARLDDLALMLDPAKTTASNIPTGAIRWDSASSKWQIWSGTAWGNLTATYAINALTASSAAKWTTARTLSLSGDVTGSASVDGSANATISATLSNTGVTAGTYKSVTVDAKGRVTGATNPTTLAGYGITNAVPSADVAQAPAANKIVKATADGPIDLGWLDTSVARELRMLAVGVNPSLDLDFGRQNYRRQNGAKGLETLADPFASFITFTRSTTASYIGADGLLKTAAINEPRIEYDPITGECKGLLVEESRANLLTYSEAFDNAAWGKTRASVNINVLTAPDGTVTSDKLIEDATASISHLVAQNANITANTQYTLSVFAKAGQRSKLRVYPSSSASWSSPQAVDFDIANGIVINGAGEIKDIGNGWYRCSIPATAGAVNAVGGIGIQLLDDSGSDTYTGDGTSGLYIWGAQLEAGSFPTSYIKTAASAVTRSADNASVTGANFSSWYRRDEGTILAGYRGLSLKWMGTDRVVAVSAGTFDNHLTIRGSGTGSTSVVSTVTISGTGLNMINPLLDVSAKNITAFGYKAGDHRSVSNGGASETNVNATALPLLTRMDIGLTHTSIGQLNGHISRLTYWPKRLTNAQLQELSK